MKRKLLGDVIAIAVTKHAHRLGFTFEWQERFHDHIICDDTEYQRIVEYVRSNPMNWETDKFYINQYL